MSHPRSPAPLYRAPIDEAERRAALDARQRELSDDARVLCDSLRLARLCPRKACRRADDCRGEPRACLDTHGEAVPREARDFAQAMLDADKGRESADELETDYPEEAAAWRAWITALDARVRRRGRSR